MTSWTFCLADDRKADETGIRLLLLSLRKFYPEATVHLYRPDPATGLLDWLKAFPLVKLITDWSGSAGWNCKIAVISSADKLLKKSTT